MIKIKKVQMDLGRNANGQLFIDCREDLPILDVKKEINSLGGHLVSEGCLSKTSTNLMHNVGYAFDLEKNEYLVEPSIIVWSKSDMSSGKTDNGFEVEQKSIKIVEDFCTKKTKEVEGFFINITKIFEFFGFFHVRSLIHWNHLEYRKGLKIGDRTEKYLKEIYPKENDWKYKDMIWNGEFFEK